MLDERKCSYMAFACAILLKKRSYVVVPEVILKKIEIRDFSGKPQIFPYIFYISNSFNSSFPFTISCS